MKWLLSLCGVLLCLSESASAQGLIWSLPADGQWVRYEGKYSQTVRRPESTQGDLALEWRRIVTLKSVGTEDAEYRTQSQPCRWIEIKIETGKTAEGVLDAGPGGVQMYKLLVPEAAIKGEMFEKIATERQVFVSFLPVVKGLRKSGDNDAVEIESGVFQLAPIVSLIAHYPEFEPAGSPEAITVQAGEFESTLYKGTFVTETPTSRSTNTSEVFRSPGIPFGVVKWTASIVTETKGSVDLRSDFKEATTISEDMQAVATGDGAESDFVDK
ncbi:hypothetical protein [Planctomicrobium piriforme]|uniref:Uncharacterized protein n=1 Tax=Planctomicrobium piriforme TaxID=1576369 RepID=A0A1I3DJP4_9PLAN|nr:hypothetical protein [Planctomicrobium piriforme]SFH86964.1 hypothetical protein SAMN05421753_103280 [Planctomicrobium piriforme]